MSSIASSNNTTSTSAAALLAAAGNSSADTANQDFQRMLRSHAAQLSISSEPIAPPSPPKAIVQVEQPKDGPSDMQREEARLSMSRKQNTTTTTPVKNPPAKTDKVAAEDAAADAPSETAQQADSSTTQAAAKPQPTNAPAPTADARNAKPASAKDGKKASDDDSSEPADAAEDCSAPEMRSTTGDTGATLDPAAVLAAAQLNDKTAAALQTEADGAAATGKARTQAGDVTQARQAAGADAADASQQASTQQTADAAAQTSFASLLGAAGKQAAGATAGIAPGAVDHGASAQIAALAGLPSAAANSAAGTATPTASTSSPQVLSQPLHDPGFASEMSARLSVLASQGVQEAQLHLNPAEMGPVQVQIVVDGQQAQVSFHAEHAETRAVLERSLPDLAAALRDTGLTLSGGGVFQAASGGSGNGSNGSFQQQARDGAASSAAGNGRIQRVTGADDALPAISRAGGVRGGPVRGVVDLYA